MNIRMTPIVALALVLGLAACQEEEGAEVTETTETEEIGQEEAEPVVTDPAVTEEAVEPDVSTDTATEGDLEPVVPSDTAAEGDVEPGISSDAAEGESVEGETGTTDMGGTGSAAGIGSTDAVQGSVTPETDANPPAADLAGEEDDAGAGSGGEATSN